MKVQTVYLIGINAGVYNQQEIRDSLDGLEQKYQGRNAQVYRAEIDKEDMVDHGRIEFLLRNYGGHLQRQRDFRNDYSAFAPPAVGIPVLNPNGGNGAGAYFVFHGSPSPGYADIGIGTLSRLTQWLMERHPNGQLRKVVLLACGYGGKHSALPPEAKPYLQRLADRLMLDATKAGIAAADLPKLAAWRDYVTVSPNGSKLAGQAGSNQAVAASTLRASQKVHAIVAGNNYVFSNYSADDWHDQD